MLGLLYGKGTWVDNAEALLEVGIPFSVIIATTEDIFAYLVLKGLSEKDAYRVAERVGRCVSKSDEKSMEAYDVPGWYVDSCKKIRGLYSKAQCILCVVIYIILGNSSRYRC